MQKPGKNHSMASGLEAERSQNLELSLIPKWKHLESRSIWQAREGQIEQLETGAEEKQERERNQGGILILHVHSHRICVAKGYSHL